MKSMVVCDSTYGNTAKVGEAVASALDEYGDVSQYTITEAPNDWNKFDLAVIGSPTQGGTYTKQMKQYLSGLKKLVGPRVAVFDTRFSKTEHGFWLKMMMNIIGFAAPKLARAIKNKGGAIAGKPEGFMVRDTKGPLHDGELERAKAWISDIVENGLEEHKPKEEQSPQ